MMKIDFCKELVYVQKKTTEVLQSYYQNKDNSLNLFIEYSLINQGKKYRPFLFWSICKSLGIKEDSIFKIAAVLEMLHTYSLIHDDLPSMDNDNLRHGKESLHKKFGEANAILTGDALLTDAFYFLSSSELNEEANIKIKIINCISEYLGSKGMILGQILDINLKDNNINIDYIKHIHILKTAKFIELSIILGAVLSELNEDIKNSLSKFGTNIGLAFQIQDDIKDLQNDRDNNIVNICNYISKNEAKEYVKQLVNEAIETIKNINYDFRLLVEFALHIL